MADNWIDEDAYSVAGRAVSRSACIHCDHHFVQTVVHLGPMALKYLCQHIPIGIYLFTKPFSVFFVI